MILVLGDCPQVSVPLLAGLASEGYRARLVVPGSRTRGLPADCYETDLGSPDALAELHRLCAGAEKRVVGCIINLLPLCEPFCRPGLGGGGGGASVDKLTKWTFNVVKEFAADLRAAAGERGGWFFNVTALDGSFGLSRGAEGALAGAGTIGLAKALKREYPALRVRNLDVEPKMEPSLVVSRIYGELWSDDDSIEIGLGPRSRVCLQMQEQPAQASLSSLPIDEQSVVLVTGGAYGITAAVTRSIAAARPNLIVIGRSQVPGAEDANTATLDEAGLRRHFLERARAAGASIVPAQLERSVRQVVKERQIRANLAAFAQSGAQVEYRAVDVRDAKQFGALIDEVYARYRRLDGVIHGAGVIHDKLIRDKSLEQFDAVFGTKVDAALTLAAKLRPESLKFLIFFSSVAARFGNAGQADYSAANEFLNKLADHLHARWAARVLAINWGPWEAGMFTGELARAYAARGIRPIPIDEGVRFFERELKFEGNGSAEIIASASLDGFTETVVGLKNR